MISYESFFTQCDHSILCSKSKIIFQKVLLSSPFQLQCNETFFVADKRSNNAFHFLPFKKNLLENLTLQLKKLILKEVFDFDMTYRPTNINYLTKLF